MSAPSCLLRAWHAHEQELLHWLTRQTDDGHMAQDLLQDLFLKAIRQGERFCDIADARAWLFAVARNALSDHWRRRREALPIPEDLIASDDTAPVVDSLASCLPRVLAELAAKDREAIECCDLAGLSQADYAARSGLTLPAAKSRIQRARLRLKRQLAQSCQLRFDEQGRVCCFVPRSLERT